MYVEQVAPRPNRRQSYSETLLYAFFYALLWLRHRARKAYNALKQLLKRARTALLKKDPFPRNRLRLQNHLAISGAISLHVEHLTHLIAFIVAAGTTHVTLYDHLRPICPTSLTTLLCQHDLHSFQISEIGLQKTCTRYSTCEHHEAHSQCCLSDEKPLDVPKIRLTLVNPGTGRAAIARSARILAERQTIDSPEVTPEDVTEWLDKDHTCCMLPSEPDTVVVFPPPGGRSIPILNEFPVWQLRLTQIRFSARPITRLSTEEFSDMVSSAASAPKRFGR